MLAPWVRLAPDPEAAARRLERLAAAGLREEDVVSEDALDVLKIAVGPAPYLTALAARDPRRLLAAAADPYLRREKPVERMRAELAARVATVSDAAGLITVLRAWRAEEFIRLGARECGLGDPEEVARELAHLADVALDGAIAFHEPLCDEQLGEPRHTADDGTVRRPAFTVFGMGKLGGEELNFSSDVDVIYAYESDNGQTSRGRSLHEYFDRLARRVAQALAEVTDDDIVFRVDARLRPEGTRGPLVNSLPSLERYYESWGRPWERQAWLKARACAGSAALGAEILAMLEPFIYPRTVGPELVQGVEELNRRIKAELLPGNLETGFDVKLGVGGIREIEFFVQALQLVHAGKNRDLRERSTRRALDRLLFAGLVAERERRALGDAYAFLRQVEHRLQLDSGRQTHKLPKDPQALDVLARCLGFGGVGELRGTLELHTDAVAGIFATLGRGRELRPEIAAVLDPGRSEAALEAALAALGFADPANAAFQIGLARRRPGSPLHAAAGGAAARIAPLLVEELAASADPDQALGFFVDFLGALGSAAELTWQAFLDQPPRLRLTLSLFGTSAFLAKTLVRHPELLDHLLYAPAAAPDPAASARARVAEAEERGAGSPETIEELAWNALRRCKNEEVLRIGLADVAGVLDGAQVTASLSRLADVCLGETLTLTRAWAARRKLAVPPLVVLALGKLGSGELGYASDLDLVFIYDGSVDEHEAASKTAQRLLRALGANLEEGRLYEVDTRLRPSGNQGTLVSSLAAFRQYHAGQAALWERQALVRARPAAGDPALLAQVEREITEIVYGRDPGDLAALAAELAAMRDRVERELAGPGDIKLGRGGLLDIEFAAQYLQLAYGHAHPALRVRGTAAALHAAAAAGLIDDDTRARLCDGLAFLRRLENRLRIVHDRPIQQFPDQPNELEKLARRTGFASGAALSRAYRGWTRAVRAGYEEIVSPRTRP